MSEDSLKLTSPGTIAATEGVIPLLGRAIGISGGTADVDRETRSEALQSALSYYARFGGAAELDNVLDAAEHFRRFLTGEIEFVEIEVDLESDA